MCVFLSLCVGWVVLGVPGWSCCVWLMLPPHCENLLQMQTPLAASKKACVPASARVRYLEPKWLR